MFYLQRQWSKLQFEAQNMNSSLEIPLQEYIKLAPYICDSDKLKQYCMPRSGEVRYTVHRKFLTVQSFEPLLSFQSGWAILDAIRPFNQQNMYFPLAIQDYSIQMTPFADANAPGRFLKNKRIISFKDDIQFVEGPVDQEIPIVFGNGELLDHEKIIFEGTLVPDLPSDVELVAFSQNDVIQSNKDVSDVMLHAPEFHIYSKKFTLALYDDQQITFSLPVYTSSVTPDRLFIDPTDPGQGDMYVDRPDVTTDLGEPPTIRFNTALGLPSLIMLYAEFADNVSPDNLPFIHGAHPRIDILKIKLFDQDIPIVRNLNTDELRYITRKNSHPNYFKDKSNPIVLLDLESLGLGKDLPGYPSRDRVSVEISLLEVTLPGIPRRQYASKAIEDGMLHDPSTIVDPQGDPLIPVIPNVLYVDKLDINIEFKCVFIYENRVVEGNVNQMKINRKY